MISEQRFGRLEDKVEKLDDKLDSVKSELTDLKLEVRIFTSEVKSHVAGDDKIISEIVPVINQLKCFLEDDLPKIKVIIREKDAEIVTERKTTIFKSKLKLNLSIIGGILGIVLTLYKMDIIKF